MSIYKIFISINKYISKMIVYQDYFLIISFFENKELIIFAGNESCFVYNYRY